MTDQELRAIVRDAVARHLGAHTQPLAPPMTAPRLDDTGRQPSGAVPHPSHALYLAIVNTGDRCQIEDSVACDHCGYCKSHGF